MANLAPTAGTAQRTLTIKKIFCVQTDTIGYDDVYLRIETEQSSEFVFVAEMNEDTEDSEKRFTKVVNFTNYTKLKLYTDEGEDPGDLAGVIDFNYSSHAVDVGYKTFQAGDNDGRYYMAFSLSEPAAPDQEYQHVTQLVIHKLHCDVKEDVSDDELMLNIKIGGEDFQMLRNNVKPNSNWSFDPPFTTWFYETDRIMAELYALNLDIDIWWGIDQDDLLGTKAFSGAESGSTIASFTTGANYTLYYDVNHIEPPEPEPIKLAFNLKRIEIIESGSRTPIEWELDFRAGYVDSQDDLQNVQPHVWTEKVTSDTTYKDVAWSCEFEVDETSDKVLKIEVGGPDPNHPNDPEKQLPQATLMFAASENWGIGYGLKECESEPDKNYSYAFYYTISDLQGADSLPSKLSADASYVTNPNHKEIHLSDCRFVTMIAAPRPVHYSELAALIESGYDCCYYCLPKMDWQ